MAIDIEEKLRIDELIRTPDRMNLCVIIHKALFCPSGPTTVRLAEMVGDKICEYPGANPDMLWTSRKQLNLFRALATGSNSIADMTSFFVNQCLRGWFFLGVEIFEIPFLNEDYWLLVSRVQ